MKFAFMAGLPRSGSSLLTALLNQRDDVYASKLNYSANILEYLDIYISDEDTFRSGSHSQRDNLMKNLFESMYSDKNVDLVIDKCRKWGTPYHRKKLLEIFDYKVKIICPVRPLKEIVASFIILARDNKYNYIDSNMKKEDFYPFWMKPIDDARVDWLLKPDSHLYYSMLSLHGAFNENSSDMYHMIQYKNLCLNTRSIMKDLETFLEIPEFEYNFYNIQTEQENDLEVYGIQNMHKVNNIIKYSETEYKKILSDYAISRCNLEDFWTDRIDNKI